MFPVQYTVIDLLEHTTHSKPGVIKVHVKIEYQIHGTPRVFYLHSIRSIFIECYVLKFRYSILIH